MGPSDTNLIQMDPRFQDVWCLVHQKSRQRLAAQWKPWTSDWTVAVAFSKVHWLPQHQNARICLSPEKDNIFTVVADLCNMIHQHFLVWIHFYTPVMLPNFP